MNKLTGKYIHCKICNKKFYVPPYLLKKGKGKYCSPKCSQIGRREGDFVKCVVCGKLYYRQRFAQKTRRNCSMKCCFKDPQRTKNLSLSLRGEKSPTWNGGRQVWKGKFNTKYVLLKNYTHPRRRKHNIIFEHRLIVERYIGRYLKKKEKVHHINRNGTDNRPENLMAFSTHGIHLRFERKCTISVKDIIFDGRKLIGKLVDGRQQSCYKYIPQERQQEMNLTGKRL